MNQNEKIFIALEEMGVNLRSTTAGDIRWQAVFFMGAAGSGKGFVKDNRYLTHAGFRAIDPDEIKKTHPKYNPESPFEVHEWSQEIALSQFRAIIGEGNGDSVIVDGTGRNLEKMKDLIGMASNAGYRTFLVYVWAPFEISIFRNRNRTRFVPETTIMQQADVIEKNFGILSGMVDKYKVIPNFSQSELKLAEKDVAMYPPPQRVRPPRQGEELQRAANMNEKLVANELVKIAKSLVSTEDPVEAYKILLDYVEKKGMAVLTAAEIHRDVPTIHNFAGKYHDSVDHLGYGMFRGQTEHGNFTFDGGGAMRHDGGVSWTTLDADANVLRDLHYDMHKVARALKELVEKHVVTGNNLSQ